jgi:hypothetical protein
MDRRKAFLKGAAVVSALVLVGSFVAYRAGAFELFSKPELQPEVQPVAAPQESAPTPPQSTFLPGSKSINLTGTTIGGLTPAGTFVPDLDVPIRTEPAPPPPPAKPPTFMGGSKSAPVIEWKTPNPPQP